MQPTLFNLEAVNAYGDAIAARNAGMAQVEKNAGADFMERAKSFVLSYLERHGPTPSEMLTDAAKVHGIKPHDDKAFGPLYAALSRAKLIRSCGVCKRRKGHASGACNIWELAK